MTDRERSRPQEREEDSEIEVVEEVESAATDDIDDLLDEIDSVLEENAEEFVRNYVQKGGE
jgi:prokaryotic ubiquitin-like protein Pup